MRRRERSSMGTMHTCHIWVGVGTGMGVHGECMVRLGKWLWAYGGEDGSGRRGRVNERGCGLPER